MIQAAKAEDFAKRIASKFPDMVIALKEFRGEWNVSLESAASLYQVCEYAKQELGFDYLVDASSVDNYGDSPRFELVYEVYGITHRCHLRLKAPIVTDPPQVPSVTKIWRGADWHEREMYDMMGIKFEGHPDLRRILMWEGYPHFPLRKDFPLAGKATDLPEVALTRVAPMEGGPFVTSPGIMDAASKEPRARGVETKQ